jgi:hypothetical protein
MKTFFCHGSTALMGLSLLSEVPRSHTLHTRYDTSGCVISALQRPLPDNTQLTRDGHLFPRRDLYPKSQQPSGRKPSPYAARPLRSAQENISITK